MWTGRAEVSRSLCVRTVHAPRHGRKFTTREDDVKSADLAGPLGSERMSTL